MKDYKIDFFLVHYFLCFVKHKITSCVTNKPPIPSVMLKHSHSPFPGFASSLFTLWKKKVHIYQQHQRELPVLQHEGVLTCACLRCHYPGRIKIMFTQLQPQTKRTFTSPLDHETWRNVQPAPCDTALCSPTDSASLCKHRRQAWPCNPALLCRGHLQPPRSPK